ncbi:MAG TPA: hypothetical protein VGK67_01960 [Myxococcales bacterium]|jgi:hypothetical protein
MHRPERRPSAEPAQKPAASRPHPERPAGEQAMSPELWERVQQAIRRLTSIAR